MIMIICLCDKHPVSDTRYKQPVQLPQAGKVPGAACTLTKLDNPHTIRSLKDSEEGGAQVEKLKGPNRR
jgi:hypothetical protein